MFNLLRYLSHFTLLVVIMALSGCSNNTVLDPDQVKVPLDYTYTIGAGDKLGVFVWGNDELSTSVHVRPDGKMSSPLVNDLTASGKTPFELGRDIEKVLAKFIRDPVVSIVVTDFVGSLDKQIRVIGQIRNDDQQTEQDGNVSMRENEAVSIPYKVNMTMLDLLVEIGGISSYAAGNRTKIIRMIDGKTKKVAVRLADLIEDADMSANLLLLPGDIVFIPESYF